MTKCHFAISANRNNEQSTCFSRGRSGSRRVVKKLVISFMTYRNNHKCLFDCGKFLKQKVPFVAGNFDPMAWFATVYQLDKSTKIDGSLVQGWQTLDYDFFFSIPWKFL